MTTWDPSNARKKEERLQRQIDELSDPRPVQGEAAGDLAIVRATELVCLVRDEGADGLGGFLDLLTRSELYGVITALAAMVPDDETVEHLLAWLAPPLQAVQ